MPSPKVSRTFHINQTHVAEVLSQRVVFIIDLRKLTFNEKIAYNNQIMIKESFFFWGGGNILKPLTKGMRDLQLVDYPPPPPQQKCSKFKVKQTSKSQD